MVNIVMTANELPPQRRRLRADDDMEPRPPRDPWKMGLGILTLEAAFALLIAYASETTPRDVVVKVAVPAAKIQDPVTIPVILAQSQPAPPMVVGRRSVTVALPSFDPPRIAPMTLAAETAPLSRRGRIDSLPGRAYTRPVNDAMGGDDSWEDRLRSSRDQYALADRPAPQAAPGPDGLARRPGVIAGDTVLPRPRQVLETMARAASGASMAESLSPLAPPRASPDRLLTQPDRPLAPDGQELPWIEEANAKPGDHPGEGANLIAADSPVTGAPLTADDLAIQPATSPQDPSAIGQAMAEALTTSSDVADTGTDVAPLSANRTIAETMVVAPARALADTGRPGPQAHRPDGLSARPIPDLARDSVTPPRSTVAEAMLPSRTLADAVLSRLRGRGSGEAILTSLPTALADPGATPGPIRPDGLTTQPGIGPSRDAIVPVRATGPDQLAHHSAPFLTDTPEDSAQPGPAGDPIIVQPPALLTDPSRPPAPSPDGAADLPDGTARRLLAERAPPPLPAAEQLDQPTSPPTQDPPRPLSRPGARGAGIDRMASVTAPTLADTSASPWQAVERLDRAATLQREAAIRPVAATPTGDIGIGGFDVHAMFDYGRHLRAGGTQVSYLPYGLTHDARSLAALFDGIDYAVGEGAHIPGVFLRRLPRDIASIPGADDRKMLFVRAVLPLIVHENEKNLTIRQRVLKLAPDIQAGLRLTAEDQGFIDTTLVRFRMAQFDLMELLARIDVIPPSLALAQAAEESGWGTSRMAREGNALFGEVMWRAAGADESGKIVREQRPFDDLATGVEAYMRNLNTHRAYQDFRRRRAAIRASGGVPDGHTLAPYLLRYSERGGDYVQAIRTLIELNNLVAFDSVRFRATHPKDTDQLAQPPDGVKGSNSQ